MKFNKFISLLGVLAVLCLLTSAAKAPSKKRSGKKHKTEQAEPQKKETAYEKLFKEKKVKTARGFMTLHLTDQGKLIVELPKSLLGRDMLIGSGVEQTSDGGDGAVGYMASKPIHVNFTATDSLVLINKVSARHLPVNEPQMQPALDNSNTGAVIAAFPIECLSPDSISVVFDATEFFNDRHEQIDPIDPLGANSANGLLGKQLNYRSECSMLYDVAGYKNNVSVSCIETFDTKITVLGMVSTEEIPLTIWAKRFIMLLPENTMRPRIADSRIGVRTSSFLSYAPSQEGARKIYYANRWNLAPGRKLTLYLDPQFPLKIAEAVTKGIREWNEAFAGIGRGDLIEVLPYPTDDPGFDPNDLQYSCIKFEMSANEKVRSQTWIDPRSGEILSATIYVPFNILQPIHQQMILQIGNADPDICDIRNDLPILYDGLSAAVTRQLGFCLGLDENLAASSSIPVDSLRSPAFTKHYGLSGSIMDIVPYNFLARPGDRERGVELVHKHVGEYDKYAIKWLYDSIPGTKTPEEEVPALDRLITESSSNPYCLYVRRQPYIGKDPRVLPNDLGNDALASTRIRFDNLRQVIARMDQWLPAQDPDHTYRAQLNAPLISETFFTCVDLARYIGGIYLNEKKAGDEQPSFVSVPRKTQRDMLKFLLETSDDLSWIDNKQLNRDNISVHSIGGYVNAMLMPELIGKLNDMQLSAEKSDNPYTQKDAYDDIYEHVVRDVKAGRKSSKDNLMFQYSLLAYTLKNSNVANSGAKKLVENPTALPLLPIATTSPEAAETGISQFPASDRQLPEVFDRTGFTPQRSVGFDIPGNNDYQMYAFLLKVRKMYANALQKTADTEMQAHYRYILMAIDRALKID